MKGKNTKWKQMKAYEGSLKVHWKLALSNESKWKQMKVQWKAHSHEKARESSMKASE